MFYEEPAKKLPVSASVDVLVLGAGPAGVAAAISAGRQGAKPCSLSSSATSAALPPLA